MLRITKSLLREPSEVSFPKHISPADLANSFGHYFVQKIDNINKSLDDPSPSLASEAGERDCTSLDGLTGATFADFKAVKKEQITDLIRTATKKSCPLDPMPTSVVLELINVLLPVITDMINLSFESSKFALAWKEALVQPLLKKSGLEIAFKNFRPVSNLPYVSKLSEKAAAIQLTDHRIANGLHMQFQSAYKQHHSTESALLKVKNDILLNTESQNITLLVLLDLSAAFDTVRHEILLSSLRSRLGVDGKALDWFASYSADHNALP